ncbi:MAG: TRAP transporter small permease [Lachnospiraceae bacterium]|jgi:TRAP-type C4-dicarboxylate transport system permease small subunit|nr:TRAP transporter small permease [Lachnospiraceae bacterium]MCI9480008.1 TRAP transporter small permease [Lachnospiraceae bacterium]
MDKYAAFVKKANQLLLGIGILFLLAAVVITAVQVFTRNVFSTSFTWAEEITRYMVIFAVYFASGTVVYMDANARVDIFYRMFSKKMQCILSCVFYLLTAVFLVVMGYYGYIYVARNMTIWCASVRIPWAVPFSALLIGAGNMLLQIPVKMWQSIKEMKGME